MTTACPQCHATMPSDAGFCPGCGRRMWVADPQSVPEFHLSNRFLAALSYFLVVPAILLIFLEKRNRFIRFHALQSIEFGIATVLGALLMIAVFALFSLIPGFGYMLAVVIVLIAAIGWVIVWGVLVIKALQGERLRLPGLWFVAEKL